ncbi:Beta-lactamase-related protein [Macrophomina phaseolina MS6]|uniref:Beta-lactamase-related protein n=1 Tax=Macrophomina phaseolina (strain MS6) TaxID=1126212 RepID=K2RUF1_MACPH|nr:Beta-lactamase-related protein [Macrophomina phaseolina MS6]
MQAADKLLKDAVENGIIAGCACMASDKNGTIQYSSGFGPSSSPQASPPAPMTTRSVFSLISSTKAMTAIAALQLVERGILSLDQDVSPLLSELAYQPVLGGPLDNPVATPRRNALLLRHLLTHSSGTTYPDSPPRPPATWPT